MNTDSRQTMAMELKSGPMVGPVIRRVVGMLAARADMRVDRVDDVILLAEALGIAAAQHCADGKLSVRVEDGSSKESRALQLEFGPLKAGTGAGAISSAHAARTVGASRADSATVRAGDGGDYVALTITDA